MHASLGVGDVPCLKRGLSGVSGGHLPVDRPCHTCDEQRARGGAAERGERAGRHQVGHAGREAGDLIGVSCHSGNAQEPENRYLRRVPSP